MKNSTFITRVVLKNYKSITTCDVQLQPLTFLVGRNGAGKSNFLDALRFVADALHSSLDHAIRDRGGVKEIRNRSKRPPNSFRIHINFALPDGSTGYYAFRINFQSRARYRVHSEICRIKWAELNKPDVHFQVKSGTVTRASVKVPPAAASDRLYLVNASGLSEFRPVYEAFSRMGFYSLNLDKIRDFQAPDLGDMLIRDGSNLTSVLAKLPPPVVTHIEEYLAAVVPGVRGVKVKEFGPKATLAFRQDIAGTRNPWQFLANNMSDGTLRVLGILVALFQENPDLQKRVLLVGIEEPEIALHPAAAGVLLDGLQDAAEKTQVIVTSHSPDLLDNKDLDVESILAVEAYDGNTVIAPVDAASRSVLREKLYTTGELLRLDQLQPDLASVVSSEEGKQLSIYDVKIGKSNPTKSKEKRE